MSIGKRYRRFWRYDPKAGMPVWVFRKMHRLEDGEDVLTTCLLGRLYEARPGDYIVEIEEGIVLPLKPEQFAEWEQG